MDRKGQDLEKFIDKSAEISNKWSSLEKFGAAITIVGTSIYAIPRVSPIFRVLFLGFRSLIKKPPTKSLRSKDVELIRKIVHTDLQNTKDQFLVVKGPKGIGKSVAIENALAHTWSVCYIESPIQPGLNKLQIVDQVLDDFTDIDNRFIRKSNATKHVIFWNGFFTFLSGRHCKPIIVISTQERKKGEQYAQIEEAARDLAIKGIRVVIDSSDGALPKDHVTIRELVIEIEPMSIDLVEKIPEIDRLVDFLKTNNMFGELLFYGKDYPLGFDYFKTRLRKAFRKNIAIQDPIEIQKLIDRGEFVIKEIDALYKLRKYRHLKKSYYEDNNEKN